MFGRSKPTPPQLAAYQKPVTYSQRGEDILIDAALSVLRIEHPTYLDIGAFHPSILSNTALFYLRGERGVCVEPDPELCSLFAAERPRDKIITAAVSAGEKGSAEFFVMSERFLNTLSRVQAEALDKAGEYRIEKVISVPLVSANDIIEANFPNHPSILSLDTEGNDLNILTDIDFHRFRPEVICAETLTFSENRLEQRKVPEIGAFLAANGYFAYADTYLNTIFVDSSAWSR